MMFRLLGQVVRRAWVFLLAGWALLLVATWLAAPSWKDIAREEEFAFLPADVPSRRAAEAFAEAFPDDKSASNIVLVLHRTGKGRESLKRDLKFIEDEIEAGLQKIAEEDGGLASEIKPSDEPLFSDEDKRPKPAPKRSIMARIRTPTAPGIGTLLVSPDRKALLVVIELTTDFTSHANWPTIEKIEDLVRGLREQGKIPADLEVAVTGSAVIGRDHARAELRGVQATGLLTVVLVAGLLLFIYRAPLLALIPLVTVALAVQISLHVLTLMARAGLIAVFDSLQIYITILAYGAGVDYCLFLTARYKEELDRGVRPAEAVATAVGGVGTALTASAGTVMFGIAMMSFAQFGKFQAAGLAIPLSLFLVLCATLTFSPAVLCLAGRWAFWPQRLRPKPERSARQAGDDAGRPPGADPAVLAEPAEARLSPGWFSRGGPLERIWEKVGQLLLRRAGTVWLITVAVMVPFAVAAVLLYGQLSYDIIGDLPRDAPSTIGTRLLQEHFPAGMVGSVTVLLVDPKGDFRTDQGREVIVSLTEKLRRQQRNLELADIRSFSSPLGITEAAREDFSGLRVSKEEREEAVRSVALQHYLTDLGKGSTKIGTRLDLIFEQSPFARRTVENLGRLEEAVRDALPEDVRRRASLYFLGTTASVRDLSLVMAADRSRIEWLVLVSVFVILVILLRRFVISLYLLLSVLFSYYTALGVTFAVFWLLDPTGFVGIDWKVAIFLFTILIAVGEDYNIFLMTRIDEEERGHGPVRGITEALDRTGPIITSCGIIMAGTFLSLLLAGPLKEMKQLGFALAFGVLLDTFVVRPILVPAFLILLRTGRLRLRRAATKEANAQAQAGRPQDTARAP
jgi:RND superfamily putative drug exporter